MFKETIFSSELLIWSAARELDSAEPRLRHKAVVGRVVMGRAGSGSFPILPDFSSSKSVRKEETRTSRMAGMRQQGEWMKWKLTWKDIWRAELHLIKFLIASA